jgi:hypothetical protein
MTTNLFRLEGFEYPYGDPNYIGFVLDALRDYLSWNVKEYSFGGGPLASKAVSASMENGKGKIIVSRVEGNLYRIDGFPEEANFEDFREKAPGILQRLVNGNSGH